MHLINVVFFYKAPFLDAVVDLKALSIVLLYSFSITAVSVLYVYFFYSKRNWETISITKLLAGIFLSTVMVLPPFFLCRIVHLVFIEQIHNFQTFLANEKLIYYVFPFVSGLIISLLFHVIGYYKALQEKRGNKQKIDAETRSPKFPTLKKIIKITVIVIIINMLLIGLFDLDTRPLLDTLSSVKHWLTASFYCFIITAIMVLYFDFIIKKLSWQRQGLTKLILGILGSVILALITMFISTLVLNVGITKSKTFEVFINSQRLDDYIISAIFTLMISLFFLVIDFYKALQEKKVNEQKIIAGTANAKFAALKNQLDPHFLFNSLNVLTSLIEEDPNAAQKFTTSLSKVYRYVLEQKNKDVIAVQEELEFAKIYMSLLQMRFEDSVFLELPEKLDNPEAKIAPLSLQLLLENTVKHNIVTESKPLRIKIYEKAGFLYVTNNLQPKAIMKTESGVGLSNISQRYKMLTKRPFSVEKTTEEFIAKLPILTKKIYTVINEDPFSKTRHSFEYDLAKEKVKKIRGFYASLIMYCIAMPIFISLNLKTSPNYYWFVFPLIGWGFGLTIQALNTFKNHLFLGKDWEQHKLKQFLEEENSKQ